MNKEVIEVLKQCTVSGLFVRLPAGQLDRKIYTDLKKCFELIGGAWKGGKIQCFVFEEDPTDLLAQVATGEKRNIRKEFQFFGTPDVLADRLVELASPMEDDIILEPSAGRGAILNAIERYIGTDKMVDCYEIMPLNQKILKDINICNFRGYDFLLAPDSDKYNVIIANPPFSKNQDIDHIYKMYSLLAPKGRIVTVCSAHYRNSNGKKESDFKNWLSKVNADIQEVPAGAFKQSGTSISTLIIIIDKDKFK